MDLSFFLLSCFFSSTHNNGAGTPLNPVQKVVGATQELFFPGTLPSQLHWRKSAPFLNRHQNYIFAHFCFSPECVSLCLLFWGWDADDTYIQDLWGPGPQEEALRWQARVTQPALFGYTGSSHQHMKYRALNFQQSICSCLFLSHSCFARRFIKLFLLNSLRGEKLECQVA